MSSKIYSKTLNSWDEFLQNDTLKKVKVALETKMLFRGQSAASQPLRPSILRAIGEDKHVTTKRALKLEEIAQQEFAADAYMFLHPTLIADQSSVVRWWMIMQHFGAPTRLLDWSYSPYIAAYFACAGSEDTDGAIWYLDIRASDFRMPKDFDLETEAVDDLFTNPDADPILHILLHGPQNDRMIAQQGVFTLSQKLLSSHDQILSRIPKSRKRNRFGKLIIPASQKRTFLRNLSVMNITARSLFPGIEGLGKSVFDTIRLLAKPHM